MGKDTKDMLKTILSNQELIMKHLKITKSASAENNNESQEDKAPEKKATPKKVAGKKR